MYCAYVFFVLLCTELVGLLRALLTVQVQINTNSVLSISGSRQQRFSSQASSNAEVVGSEGSNFNASGMQVQRRRQERRFGSFNRTWNLPEDANVSEIKASVDQGVLTVVVSRVQPTKSEVIEIPVS